MKKLIILSFSMFLTIITSAYSKDYNLGDLEKIGFQKDSQQFYQMIGAIDGWAGTLSDDTVEVYFFENKKKLMIPFSNHWFQGTLGKTIVKKIMSL